MNVYFQQCGYRGNSIVLQVYVQPRRDGHAYHYNADGSESLFAWVNPDIARVFDSSEIPSELWYSIQHGLDYVEIDMEKDISWNLSDLKYDPVKKEEIDAYIKAQTEIDNVGSIEEFKQLYPLIKKGNRASRKMIDKLFSLVGVRTTPPKNGETGIAFFMII